MDIKKLHAFIFLWLKVMTLQHFDLINILLGHTLIYLPTYKHNDTDTYLTCSSFLIHTHSKRKSVCLALKKYLQKYYLVIGC